MAGFPRDQLSSDDVKETPGLPAGRLMGRVVNPRRRREVLAAQEKERRHFEKLKAQRPTGGSGTLGGAIQEDGDTYEPTETEIIMKMEYCDLDYDDARRLLVIEYEDRNPGRVVQHKTPPLNRARRKEIRRRKMEKEKRREDRERAEKEQEEAALREKKVAARAQAVKNEKAKQLEVGRQQQVSKQHAVERRKARISRFDLRKESNLQVGEPVQRADHAGAVASLPSSMQKEKYYENRTMELTSEVLALKESVSLLKRELNAKQRDQAAVPLQKPPAPKRITTEELAKSSGCTVDTVRSMDYFGTRPSHLRPQAPSASNNNVSSTSYGHEPPISSKDWAALLECSEPTRAMALKYLAMNTKSAEEGMGEFPSVEYAIAFVRDTQSQTKRIEDPDDGRTDDEALTPVNARTIGEEEGDTEDVPLTQAQLREKRANFFQRNRGE